MNFFIYRKPGESEITGFKSETHEKGVREDSFVIGSFENDPTVVLSIPCETRIDVNDLDPLMEEVWGHVENSKDRIYPFPQSSGGRECHRTMVETIVGEIKAGKLDKCVAARASVAEGSVKLSETFRRLCEAYPEAFVFCFHTPESGLWMGASPEILLSRNKENLHTMALAGTLPAESDKFWDEKNLREHRVVIDFICDSLSRHGIMPETEKTETVSAGPVKHLCTRISGNHTGLKLSDAFGIACGLSPTPALSGMPREKAIDLIRKCETFTRGFYGGFVGTVDAEGNFDLYVNLRSMSIARDKYCQIAGGGIMAESEADAEWDETENKMKAIGNHIVLRDVSESCGQTD